MSRRGSWGSMADRVAQGGEDRSAHSDVPPAIQHCWVTDHHGRLPALLLGWQRREPGWFGRVVRLVHQEQGWIVVEEWLPAHQLEPSIGGR
jgi:hypothetical protein